MKGSIATERASRDVELVRIVDTFVPGHGVVAMVDLRDNTEIVPIAIIQVDLRGYCHGNTLSYENCYRAFVRSGQRTASKHAVNLLVCRCCRLG